MVVGFAVSSYLLLGCSYFSSSSGIMTSSEDVLLQVGQVRYKKGDGTLYVMNERLAWMMDHRDTVSVSHRYADIKMQKVSPDGKAKIQLQVVLHDGSASTFQFVNKNGQDNQMKERDDVKQLLQQLLLKFKREINKELEEKNKMLSENPWMLQLYRDLVITQVISAEEFWAQHATQLVKEKTLLPKQDIGVSGAFLADIKPQTDGCNGLKYNLTADVIECIFKTYPAVRKKHLDQVPLKISEGDFWTKFFQSHYFHRDRINTGTKDLFTECAKLDDIEIRGDIDSGISDPLVDLISFNEKCLDDAYGTTSDKPSIGNMVHQNMIKRFNQHSIMVIKACASDSENPSPDSTLNGDISSGSDRLSTNGTEQISKKRRIQDKIKFDDLSSSFDLEIASQLTLFKVDRYLHGPVLCTNNVSHNVLKNHTENMRDEIKSWSSARGMPYVTPAAAVSALGELTPGGALMKGFRENSLAQMVAKDTQFDLKNLYIAGCELLRHFWATFPPTSVSLETKAVAMHEALHRFQSARLKPFEDGLSREFSPLSQQLASHLNQLLDFAFRRFDVWQRRQKTQSR